MRTIQEVGTEILNNTPGKFYIFCGSEYGIKCKYLDILKKHYGTMTEYESVESLLNLMSTQRFIPLEPALYVVRYDLDFLSSLSDASAKEIDSANIIGTIVCIYELSKHTSKLDKYLPNYTVMITEVSRNFKIKYLKSDFPQLPDRLINISAEYATDYYEAYGICKSMSTVDPDRLLSMSDFAILELFGKTTKYTEADIRRNIASKNFTYLVNLLDIYTDSYDTILYTILSTLIELEKIAYAKYSDSILKEYSKFWTVSDIGNMFFHTYEELKKLRTYNTDAKLSLVYLFALLRFKTIPSVEFMAVE